MGASVEDKSNGGEGRLEGWGGRAWASLKTSVRGRDTELPRQFRGADEPRRCELLYRANEGIVPPWEQWDMKGLMFDRRS